MPSPSTTPRHRRRRRRTTPGPNPLASVPQAALTIVMAFVMIWVIGLGVSHMSLTSLPHPSDALDLKETSGENNAPPEAAVLRGAALVAYQDTPGKLPADPSNPFLGWQPAIADTMDCPWRQCLRENNSCTTCREDKLDAAPSVPDDRIPDVTMLARMRVAGVDATGKPWPPPLDDPQLCEPMGAFGGKSDTNMKCTYDDGPTMHVTKTD